MVCTENCNADSFETINKNVEFAKKKMEIKLQTLITVLAFFVRKKMLSK